MNKKGTPWGAFFLLKVGSTRRERRQQKRQTPSQPPECLNQPLVCDSTLRAPAMAPLIAVLVTGLDPDGFHGVYRGLWVDLVQ
jgi:hypothetical protein